jgi:hypothetical protein
MAGKKRGGKTTDLTHPGASPQSAARTPNPPNGVRQAARPAPSTNTPAFAPSQAMPALAEGNARQGILADSTPSPSRYNELAGPQPPPVIRDIDPGNWYSPFQPIAPFGPPSVRYPRAWDYRTGINLDYAPERFAMFEQLQLMSRSWGVLRTVIETRKDQIMRMPWAFQVRGAPKKKSRWVDQLTDFFRRPDGKTTYQAWKRMYFEDLFVIDAPTIYKYRAVDGTPLALQVLNGATIKPLIDDAGRRPDYPSPAFQQIIKGLPMTNFDETELMYAPMRPTPQFPIYGYSPVEQIYVEVMIGIKRLMYQSNYWSEGSMPELIITVPDTWTPQQTAMFQAHFDALMAGNLNLKSRVRFMPGGMKPFDIKNANGEGLFGKIDEFWARLICFAFSVSPTPFIQQVNRATAETAQETAEEEGLHPLMTWDKAEVMDPIVQEDFGYDEIEFNYLPEPEVDEQKQMIVIKGYVDDGIYNRNEARDKLGLDPIQGTVGDEYTVTTPQGPIPLQESVDAAKVRALNVPNELDNAQESHDVQIKNQKQQAAQPQPKGPHAKKNPAKKVADVYKFFGYDPPPFASTDFVSLDQLDPRFVSEVGKAAIVPFLKSASDAEVEGMRSSDPTLADQRENLEAAVASVFSAMAPVVGQRITRAIVDAIGDNGELPDDQAVEALAEQVASEVSLEEFAEIVGPAEEALAAVGIASSDRSAGQLRIAVGDEYGGLVDRIHEQALDYARERGAELVGMVRNAEGDLVPNPDAEMAISDTTRERIKNLIVQKLEPGEPFNLQWSIEDIVDDLTGSPLFSRSRAALIAQAEVGMASGRGSLVALEQAAALGLKVKKRWSTSHDEKVCIEECLLNELAGEIPLALPFPSGDMSPLAHPRCRCALIGIVADTTVLGQEEEAA